MDIKTDQIAVKDLQARYQLKQAAVYARLKRLNIQPIKAGRRGLIDAEQLAILDALDQHLKQGRTIESFLSPEAAIAPASEPSPVIAAIIEALTDPNTAIAIRVTTGTDRFAYYRILEEAAAHHWELLTSEVAELLNLTSKTVNSYGQSFEQAGFIFTRSPSQRQGENCWQVTKPGRRVKK